MVLWKPYWILDTKLDLESSLGVAPNVIASVGAKHIEYTEEQLTGKHDSFQSLRSLALEPFR
jgi:hypothetical protein